MFPTEWRKLAIQVGNCTGSERTQTLSGQSAQAIAETARKFGQEDDITILAVTYGCHSARTRLRQAELRDWIRVVVGLRATRNLPVIRFD
jgi:hypothetical protein